jgi:hypothetical protein
MIRAECVCSETRRTARSSRRTDLGAALSSDGRPQAGMESMPLTTTATDSPICIVTNFSHDYNTLYENGPAGVFTDRSYATGIAATAGPYLWMGRQSSPDFDNDDGSTSSSPTATCTPKRHAWTRHAYQHKAAVPQRGQTVFDM